MPKLPCTRAQLPKRGRIEVFPEQDSREMLVQIPSHTGVPSFPRASAQQGGTGRWRSLPCALLPSILCWHLAEPRRHAGRRPGCMPRGLDALSGTQEPLWQGAASAASLMALPRP